MKKKPIHMKDEGELQIAEDIASLVTGYICETLKSADHDKLDAWVQAKNSNMLLFEEVTDGKTLQKDLELIEEADVQVPTALKKCMDRISFTH